MKHVSQIRIVAVQLLVELKRGNTINNRKSLVSVDENEPELQKPSLISYFITEILKQEMKQCQ